MRIPSKSDRADYWRNVAAEFRAGASNCRMPELRMVWSNLATLCEDLANANLKTMTLDIIRDEKAARWHQRVSAYTAIAKRERNVAMGLQWVATKN